MIRKEAIIPVVLILLVAAMCAAMGTLAAMAGEWIFAAIAFANFAMQAWSLHEGRDVFRKPKHPTP